MEAFAELAYGTCADTRGSYEGLSRVAETAVGVGDGARRPVAGGMALWEAQGRSQKTELEEYVFGSDPGVLDNRQAKEEPE